MTPDRTLATLSAAFLRSTQPLQVFGGILCAVAAGGLLLATRQAAAPALWLFGATLLLGLALAWYALRIRFDAAAFELIATHEQEARALPDFDAALSQLGLRQGTDVRDLAQRAAATRKLVVRLAAVVCAQLILVLAASGFLYVA
ncbi:hypothetical protein [Uliginosibacterium aquaticum]|uniref:Integral membrane plasmid transfer protein n=1 Tax=Uliginosibacterium aquaticum TaxID=2731212 RepID=A0ABX2IDF5_9RHOO|nr:hypothetical protein [Uliginosibacterium aquaticum]NSL54584.1 hypothetical protein [Uliginosibacterium aquaticum]